MKRNLIWIGATILIFSVVSAATVKHQQYIEVVKHDAYIAQNKEYMTDQSCTIEYNHEQDRQETSEVPQEYKYDTPDSRARFIMESNSSWVNVHPNLPTPEHRDTMIVY